MTPLTLRRWTREEYKRLGEAGILGPDDNVELVNGLVVRKLTHNPPHFVCVHLLADALRERLPKGLCLRVQGPIALDDANEPEPDLAVAIGSTIDYAYDHPSPEQVELVIELADSSLGRDRRYKLPLYAGAGVREVWLVDLGQRRVEVHTNPGSVGYQSVELRTEEADLTPRFALADPIPVKSILPPTCPTN